MNVIYWTQQSFLTIYIYYIYKLACISSLQPHIQYVLWSWLFRVIIWYFALAAVFQYVLYYEIQIDSEPISLYSLVRIFGLRMRCRKMIPPKYMLPCWGFLLSCLEAPAREISLFGRSQKDPAGREIVGVSRDVHDVYNERLKESIMKDRMKVRILEK